MIAAILISTTITKESETGAVALEPTHYVASAESEAIVTTPLSPEEWEIFKEEKTSLLKSTLTLRVPDDEFSLENPVWTVRFFDHPEWIVIKRPSLLQRVAGVHQSQTHATVNTELVQKYIEEEIAPHIPAATDLRILALPDEDEVRAEAEGEIVDGWRIPTTTAAIHVAEAVSAGLLTITLPIEPVQGTIVNETGIDLGDLSLIARGKSNYAGSVPERIFNIKKALNEHLNYAIVAPGTTFSFNDSLGGEVETYNGWQESLGIFNGNELKPTAGGGICQVSTTTYRALLQAGLPVTEQRNHSMYINYYKQHGEGLDATVYMGQQDLMFENDTGNYLFLMAYNDGEEAIVEIYGTDDGRQVSLEGPYRMREAPEDLIHSDGQRYPLGYQSIAWRQRIKYGDGIEKQNVLVSHYTNEIPWNAPKDADDVEIILAAPLTTESTEDVPPVPEA
jgi:hypothetical protein